MQINTLTQKITQYLLSSSSAEDHSKIWILSSLAMHVVIFLFSPYFFSNVIEIDDQEWEISAEIDLGSFSSEVSELTELPQAIKAEEAGVPRQMLPQLPKNFQIEDQKTVESADESQELAEKDKEPEKPEKAAEAKEQKKFDESAVKLKEKEALRRAAMEKLRREEKFSKQLEAQKRAALARLRSEVASENATSSTSSGNISKYQSAVQAQIKRCYTLPSTYNLDSANLITHLLLELQINGQIQKTKVTKSSGNKRFDDLVEQIVTKCAPFPKPPTAMQHKPLLIKLNSNQL